MNSPYVDRDSHVAALIRSRQSVEADPGDVTAHFNQALALCQLGQWEQAIAAWEHVVRLEPENAFAYVNMGIAHLEKAQWEKAEEAFTQAVRCRADHAAAHFGLGNARAQQGQRAAARDAWEQTLRLDPDHAEARYNLDFLTTLPPEKTDGAQNESLSAETANLSANMAYAAQVEYEVVSQISMLPVAENGNTPPAVKSPSENRIKLPPLSGPPLDTIAQSVIAAQHDTLTGKVVAATGQTQAEEPEPAQTPVEPTLRLDGKELKKEHRKMHLQETSAQANSSGKWAVGKWMAGGAVALLALILTVWGALAMRNQSASGLSADSPAPSSPPLAAHRGISEGQAPIPPPVTSAALAETTHNTAKTPPVLPAMPPEHDAPSAREADVPATRPVKSFAKSSTKPTPARERIAASSDAPVIHAHRTPRKRTDTDGNNSERTTETQRSSRSAQTARPKPSATTRHAGFHDEDTFPTHSHAVHGDNSEEWTDKIP